LPQTPTVDTGALGIGFPQFVCGGRKTGIIDLDVSMSQQLAPASDLDEHEEIQINVTGPAADILLTAEPATIDCDGTTSSTVTANVVNADGDNVANGLDVNFSVVALGTANPLVVDLADGNASTVVTPLAGAANVTADGQPRGVTVTVSVNGEVDERDIDPDDPSPNDEPHNTWDVVQRSILVQCSGGPPPPGTGAAPGGGGAGTGGAPTGTIRPPDTGSGGTAGGAGFGWQGLAALAAGAVVLAGLRKVLAQVR
jgi:hypothetical protein